MTKLCTLTGKTAERLAEARDCLYTVVKESDGKVTKVEVHLED